MNIKGKILIDQYGQVYVGDSIKQLKEKYDLRGKVSPMYIDDIKKGVVLRIGFVIGKNWLSVYQPVEIIV